MDFNIMIQVQMQIKVKKIEIGDSSLSWLKLVAVVMLYIG